MRLGALLGRIYARAGRVASKLLSEDAVFTMVQRGLSASLVARKVFERNVVRVWSTANVPSRQDVDRLLERIDALDREVDDLLVRVEALAERARKRRA